MDVQSFSAFPQNFRRSAAGQNEADVKVFFRVLNHVECSRFTSHGILLFLIWLLFSVLVV